ncbi:hypothetical protein C7S20_07245 [Christiangramia fulva]|uniref:DUF302 domain-containing protein n=1 Tax=Christiangramia fulva TaxID=2126553 RepID=A0A2R3Z493_9FLAO|nr:DUF302 domain-containing protein [Christiangramia fulva]AVR45079.1 hypothetical protein C7S20_07245 [Christiangramia fulva]
MKTKKFNLQTLFAILLMLALFGPTPSVNAQTAHSQTVKPVTVESKMDFDGTIEAVKKSVSGGGMMVLAELNQGKILSMTGLQVKGHSFFVGNPNVGKEAFSADPSVGVVIPVRINVYEENGKTFINYFKPSDLFASFDDKKVKMIGAKLDDKLQMMMKMISK